MEICLKKVSRGVHLQSTPLYLWRYKGNRIGQRKSWATMEAEGPREASADPAESSGTGMVLQNSLGLHTPASTSPLDMKA